MKLILTVITALVLSTPAYAVQHHVKQNVFNLPSPFTPFTPPKTPVANPVASLQKITLDDLQNALKLANGQTNLPNGVTQPAPFDTTVTGGDTRHGNCWASLVKFVGGIQANNILPNQFGLATLQQTIFNDQQLVGRPLLPDYVVTNCALTLNDANMNFVQLINALGVTAIAVPKLPF